MASTIPTGEALTLAHRTLTEAAESTGPALQRACQAVADAAEQARPALQRAYRNIIATADAAAADLAAFTNMLRLPPRPPAPPQNGPHGQTEDQQSY